jgi:hypothetical protein
MTAPRTQIYYIHRSCTTHHKEPRSHSAVTGTRRQLRTRLFHAGSRSSNTTTVLANYLARKRMKNEPERSGTRVDFIEDISNKQTVSRYGYNSVDRAQIKNIKNHLKEIENSLHRFEAC